MLFESLPSCRLYSWTCSADGRWQPTGNRALPGAWHLFDHGTETFASVFEVGLLAPGEVDTRYATFRQFSVTTGAFVDGYQVTNALPAHFQVWPAATPDGRSLAVETWDSRNPNSSAVVTLYDWKTGQRLNQLRLPALGVFTLSAGAKYLAWLSEAGGAIYTVPSLERIGLFKESFYHSWALFSGDTVALPIFHQFCIRLWNAASGQDEVLLHEPTYGTPRAFSADGGSLLTAGFHHARLYTLGTPEKLELPAHTAGVVGVAFSPDNKRVASAGTDRVLRVCEVLTGRMLWETNGLAGPGQDVGYSPDGRWLVTDDAVTDEVCIWDAQTGQRLLVVESNGAGPTFSAQFSPDGHYLATLSSLDQTNKRIKIYTIEHGGAAGLPVGSQVKPLTSISVPDSFGLVFAPGSRSVAFLSWTDDDCYAYVWDSTARLSLAASGRRFSKVSKAKVSRRMDVICWRWIAAEKLSRWTWRRGRERPLSS